MISKEDMTCLEHASRENPVFVKTDLYDTQARDGVIMAHTLDMTAAVIGMPKDSDGRRKCLLYVMDPGNRVMDTDWQDFRPGMEICVDSCVLDAEVLDPSKKLEDQLADIERKKRETPFIVYGCLYDETPIYMPYDTDFRFPVYPEKTDSVETWTVGIGTQLANGRKVQSTEDLEQWVVENHPDRLFGFMAFQNVPGGAFISTPEPGPYYPEGMYETQAARMKYADQRAAYHGTKLWAGRKDRQVPELDAEVRHTPQHEHDVEIRV